MAENDNYKRNATVFGSCIAIIVGGPPLFGIITNIVMGWITSVGYEIQLHEKLMKMVVMYAHLYIEGMLIFIMLSCLTILIWLVMVLKNHYVYLDGYGLEKRL